ncbi:TrmH family RNA methyltransferase [Aquihabitans sp. McL0605]|uniref:TrmH family RNA methyltransferase n=1 Tax=Aquihabitans sp. McL0605 TaxID=3415671 RepID=UPI003CEF3283
MTRNLGSTDLKRLHREWRRQAPGRIGLILDSVATPANVGSILRTAAAMRVEDVWFCGQTAGPELGGTKKTSLGSERYLQCVTVDTPANAMARARAAQYRIVGIELAEGAVPIHQADLRGDVCLVVGHEDRGLTPPVLDGVDQLAFIPQLGRIGSLNVATAASIALYEARRQGWPPT